MLQVFIDQEDTAPSSAPLNPNNVEKPRRENRFQKYMDTNNSQEVTELNRYLLQNFADIDADDGKDMECLL